MKKKQIKKVKWSSAPFEKERAEFFEKQKGCCGVCGRHQSTFNMRLALDHDHKTLKLRGLLCYRCNRFQVGRHTYESVLKVFKYLEAAQ